jgi:hypothetical protein
MAAKSVDLSFCHPKLDKKNKQKHISFTDLIDEEKCKPADKGEHHRCSDNATPKHSTK